MMSLAKDRTMSAVLEVEKGDGESINEAASSDLISNCISCENHTHSWRLVVMFLENWSLGCK